MHRGFLLILIIVLAFAGSYLARSLLRSGPQDLPSASEAPPHRIVSMSPSATEILFALGLGERVVGVTRFCDYPPEALEKAEIGGYIDPNYEAILDLKPDLVILREEHEEARRKLVQFKIRTLIVDHQTIPGILDSIPAIGAACGEGERADAFVLDLKGRAERIREKTRSLPRPRTLVCVERTVGDGSIGNVYIAGKEDFYDLMIEWAGGINAYPGGSVKYPVVSAEGILEMNPDVIIDVSVDMGRKVGLDERAMLEEWNSLPRVEAVKNGRVHVIGEDSVLIPGPRFVETLEKIAGVLHPKLDKVGS